jgi:thiol-disulfide isomerase/thioredoxin
MMQRVLLLVACLCCLFNAASEAATSSGPIVGTLAPDFKAHNLLTGETIPLSSQRGKIVILTFWASWCGPCRRELPTLEKAQRLIGKDRLTIFAVSFKENPDAAKGVRKLASELQINMIDDRNGYIAGRYGISAIPHLFIIDRDGNVLANHIGYGDRSLDELVDDINHALSGTPPVDPQDASSSTGST